LISVNFNQNNSFLSRNISLDFEHYQAEIIRNLRRVNSDYLQVGFYDSSFNRSLAQSMVPYQLSGVEESVALVYGELSIYVFFFFFLSENVLI